MAAAKSDQEQILTVVLRARRDDLRLHVLFALICAAALGPTAGWIVTGAWLLVYGGLQGLEAGLIKPAAPPSRARTLGLIALDSAIYGALPLSAALHGGSAATICGILFLAVGLMGAVLRHPRVWDAFAAAAGPLAAYLLIAAMIAGRASGAFGPGLAVAAAGAVLLVSAARLWRALTEVHGLQRRMRLEAERRKREADVAIGANQDFVATVREELRGPISAILAGAAAIERDASDLAVRADTAAIAQSGRTIDGMLGDLADLSSLKAGRLILDSHPFDLRALLADAVTAWAAKARGRNIQLRVEGAASLPRHMRGDPRRLRRTLDTLIAHAVRECEQGLVTLHAVAAQLETDERREFDDRDWLVRFSVSGAGASRREPQGSTLGLSVGRELARLMGGDLHRGTSDGDDLFVLEVALGAARTQPGQAPVQPQVNLRALIVDDHEMNRRALALMLEPHGVRLSSASSALGALEILASAPFDVVLMDVDIPLMDGREACRRLRGSPGVNQLTPVIACMTSADEAEWRACRMAGMNARVVKPIDAPALYLAIEQALREQRGGRRSAAA